uniref:type III-A CRISPR-associated RAMP protein Csm5 n=1 Tax=Ligilactobacillus agilis TaxID=1601 RepID=UPI003F6E3D7E
MKKLTYTKFKLSLVTVGPVHIGSGKTYNQKEYIFEDGYYYFPDLTILYKKLLSNQTKRLAFEKFLSSTKKERLTSFLNNIKFADRDLGGYKIKASGYESSKNFGQLNDISQFIRNGLNEVYIPGSSLKGALRTILVNEHFKTDDVNWGDADDIFNELRVSDSEPIPTERLILARKWDYSIKKEVANELPILRESIKPLTTINFEITTTSERAKALVLNLTKYANQFYNRYKTKFLEEFPNKYQQENIWYPLYLGSGSGLWTKVDYHHVKIDEIKRRTPRGMKMKRNGALKLTKSKPIKYALTTKDGREKKVLIKNKEHLYEMGKCGFKIKEV